MDNESGGASRFRFLGWVPNLSALCLLEKGEVQKRQYSWRFAPGRYRLWTYYGMVSCLAMTQPTTECLKERFVITGTPVPHAPVCPTDEKNAEV